MNVSSRTPGPSGGRKPVICPGVGRKSCAGILGVQAHLERVAAPLGPARPRQPLAGRRSELLADDVDSGHELGDGVLDLQARVQLDEVEGPVRPEQELEGAGVAVADRVAGALGRGLHLLAPLGRERGRRRLLDQLLVAPLDRALALAEGEHAALAVSEHLDLDVPRRRDRLLEIQGAVAERGLGLHRGGAVRGREPVRALDEPHALAAAAGGRLSAAPGSPLSSAAASASSSVVAPSVPGTTGMSAARISPFASTLSPMRAIVSALGPTKTRSLSAQASTKAGFSARKP